MQQASVNLSNSTSQISTEQTDPSIPTKIPSDLSLQPQDVWKLLFGDILRPKSLILLTSISKVVSKSETSITQPLMMKINRD
jgi:hypothetical protein